MSKDQNSPSLVFGASPKRGGPSESEPYWSVPGIISCSLALALAIAGIIVGKMTEPSNANTRGMTVVWTTMVFGLGAGAGLGIAGLLRGRASKLLPAIGLVLNLLLFGMVIAIILSIPPRAGGQRVTAVSVTRVAG